MPLKALNGILAVGCRVYNSAAISITNVTLTMLTFNSERYDTDAIHSTSSNTSRLVAPIAGRYLIFGAISYAANATGIRLARFVLNGTTIIASEVRPNTGAGDASEFAISTVYTLAAGDYVEMQAYQNSGGALNVQALGNFSPEFGMHLLGV